MIEVEKRSFITKDIYQEILNKFKHKTTKQIELMFKDFKINISDKQEFKNKYEDYVNNWQECTKNIDEVIFFKDVGVSV